MCLSHTLYFCPGCTLQQALHGGFQTSQQAGLHAVRAARQVARVVAQVLAQAGSSVLLEAWAGDEAAEGQADARAGLAARVAEARSPGCTFGCMPKLLSFAMLLSAVTAALKQTQCVQACAAGRLGWLVTAHIQIGMNSRSSRHRSKQVAPCVEQVLPAAAIEQEEAEEEEEEEEGAAEAAPAALGGLFGRAKAAAKGAADEARDLADEAPQARRVQ